LKLDDLIENKINIETEMYSSIIGESPSKGARSPILWNKAYKDFNINNLMYLPSRKKHLRCGILDFQSAFWGENCWDLFSLLEDSRVYFDNQYNEHFIKFFYKSTQQNIPFNDFKQKYYFNLICSDIHSLPSPNTHPFLTTSFDLKINSLFQLNSP